MLFLTFSLKCVVMVRTYCHFWNQHSKNFTERTLIFKTLNPPPPKKMQSSVTEILISFHQNLAKYFEAIYKGSFSLSSKVAYKISKSK